MRHLLTTIGQTMTRRARSGQAIIIIALGFIVLVAFVGIATDAALLFVRYNTLRRAVDAAAIAAAGQVREDTSYTQLVATASGYIRYHGLDPASVKVETCETDIVNFKAKNPGWESTPTNPKVIDVLISTTNGVPNSELCRKDPAKLIRVSAQINSPTTFLSVLGFSTVTLSASSVSQTAQLDVVLLIDGSSSMSGDTRSVEQPCGKNLAGRYLAPPCTTASPSTTPFTKSGYDTYLSNMPGFVFGNPDPGLGNFTLGLGAYPYTPGTETPKPTYPTWPGSTNTSLSLAEFSADGDKIPGFPYGTVRAECRKPGPFNNDNGSPKIWSANYAWGGCCNDPTTQNVGGNAADNINYFIDAQTGVIHDDRDPGGNTVAGATTATLQSGKADGNFSDLVCRPFKDVRDAARRFLLKLDYARGDRALLIQFDASAHPVRPGGLYTENDPSGIAPVFTDRFSAIDSLNRYVGVISNPSKDENSCYTIWDTYRPRSMPYDQQEYFYETVANCVDTNTGGAVQAMTSLLTNPGWIRKDAVWVGVLLSDGYPNRTPGLSTVSALGDMAAPGYSNVSGGTWNKNIHLIPNLAQAAGGPVYGSPTSLSFGRFFDEPLPAGLDNPGFCPWWTFCSTDGGVSLGRPYAPSFTGPGQPYNATKDQYSYASSRTALGNVDLPNDGTNHAFPDQVGAPGALRPAAAPGAETSLTWNQKYCTATDNQPLWWSFVNPGYASWREALSLSNSTVSIPFCLDNNPDSRHFCTNPATGQITPGDPLKCSDYYDADDFARDRVDFAALTNWTPQLKGNFISMFSIFFPHAAGNLNDNILGVKFMRYVADAGDNGVIDNPLQAWYRDQAYKFAYQKQPRESGLMPDSAANGSLTDDAQGFGTTVGLSAYTTDADPCLKYDFRNGGAGSLSAADADYELWSRTSCGNYYYAGDKTAVDRAFSDIASRLLTKLSR